MTGRFTAQDGGGSMTLVEVAAAMRRARRLPAELRGALTGDMRRDRERRELSLRLPCLRSRDRPGHRDLARSCATPPSTTSAAP